MRQTAERSLKDFAGDSLECWSLGTPPKVTIRRRTARHFIIVGLTLRVNWRCREVIPIISG